MIFEITMAGYLKSARAVAEEVMHGVWRMVDQAAARMERSELRRALQASC